MPPGGLSGFGDTSQQGDARTAAGSLSQLVPLANVAGGPIAGAAVGAAAALANIVSLFGPNPNNTITTEWVNQIEADVMKPNLAGWMALPPSQKTPSNQAAFLLNFTNSWNQLVGLCSNPNLGSAGTNCLKDRQRGGKWDWFALYFDPIAQDPAVAANVAAPSMVSTTTPVTSTSPAAAGGINNTSPTMGTPSVTAPSIYLYGGIALIGVAALFLFTGGD